MRNFQISKFNPVFIIKNNKYLRNEWTSISDIDNIFDDGILTAKKYLEVESNYLNALRLILLEINAKELKVVGLEKYDNVLIKEENIPYDNDDDELFNRIVGGEILDLKESLMLIRLIIREKIWCYLESKDIKIRIGNDFYLNILIYNELRCFSIIENELNLFVIELGSKWY